MPYSLTVAVILAMVAVGVFVINRLNGPHDEVPAGRPAEIPGTAAAPGTRRAAGTRHVRRTRRAHRAGGAK